MLQYRVEMKSDNGRWFAPSGIVYQNQAAAENALERRARDYDDRTRPELRVAVQCVGPWLPA